MLSNYYVNFEKLSKNQDEISLSVLSLQKIETNIGIQSYFGITISSHSGTSYRYILLVHLCKLQKA